MKQQLFPLIWSHIFHRERPITTGKQMLMRHLTFNSITLPLCPLLLCGIAVSSTGKTGSLVEESYGMRQIILRSEKKHTLNLKLNHLPCKLTIGYVACNPVLLCICCRKEFLKYLFGSCYCKTFLKHISISANHCAFRDIAYYFYSVILHKASRNFVREHRKIKYKKNNMLEKKH